LGFGIPVRTSDLISSIARTAAATALGGPVAGVGVGVNESIDLVSMQVGGRKVDPYETALRKIEKGLRRFARSEHLDPVVVDQALDAAEKLLTDGGATANEIAELNFQPAAVASRVLLKHPSLLVGLDPETRDLCRQIVEAIYQSLLVYDDVPGVELAFRQAMLVRIDATQSGVRGDIEALRRDIQDAAQSTGSQLLQSLSNRRLFSVAPGRLFTLPPARHDATWIGELGLRMTVPESEPIRTSTLPAGYTFLGQFLLNELAFDPVAAGAPVDDQDTLERAPRLDLASLYGRGPSVDRFLYDATGREGMFLLDTAGGRYDLPRNSQGSALAGAPGNDTNVILTQLHCLLLRFHNAVLDRYVSGSGYKRFRAAKRLVRWHFQWIVVNDYLERIAPHVLSELLQSVDGAPRFQSSFAPQYGGSYLPVEFSHAAGRLTDSELNRTYTLNDEIRNIPFFPLPSNPTISTFVVSGGGGC
jgi:hypothetical protein